MDKSVHAPSYIKPVPAVPLPAATLERALSGDTGDSNSHAVSLLVDLAKRQQALTADDARSLLAFISGPKPGDLTDGEWEERVNVIINALRGQETVVPGLTDYLLVTAEDNPSRILRLYAMQHLALWHHREASEDKRREIVALFDRLAERDGEETAGSAVMFLNDLQREAETGGHQVANGEIIFRAALKLAADSSTKQDVRISALQTCTERRMQEVLPAARQIAADTSAVLPLRKAAVCSIGRMGADEDEEFLKHLAAETPGLGAATEPALRALANSR